MRPENPYHNRIHITDVLQLMYGHISADSNGLAVLCTGQPLHTLAVLLAAIIHDLDHPGVNNDFLIKSQHPIALECVPFPCLSLPVSLSHPLPLPSLLPPRLPLPSLSSSPLPFHCPLSHPPPPPPFASSIPLRTPSLLSSEASVFLRFSSSLPACGPCPPFCLPKLLCHPHPPFRLPEKPSDNSSTPPPPPPSCGVCMAIDRFEDEQCPLEHHHLKKALELLRQPENNFVDCLSMSEWELLWAIVREMVLNTDMKRHMPILEDMRQLEQPHSSEQGNQGLREELVLVKVATIATPPSPPLPSPTSIRPLWCAQEEEQLVHCPDSQAPPLSLSRPCPCPLFLRRLPFTSQSP